MASLILGTAGSIAGGIIGGAIGGPVGAAIGSSLGYLAGSLLGNLIDPPKVEGPKLSDLKIQHSTYGAPIPVLYGTVRAAGNVIDQAPELTEHKQTSGGKGGGPKVTTYSYSVDYVQIQLCAARTFGEPAIQGLRRIWADGRLMTEIGEPTDKLPFVLYLGTETQLPDPTIEGIRGIGEVPAYLGIAHVVLHDWPLEDFGNRIPVLEFEIQASGAYDIERVSTFYDTPSGVSVSGLGTFPTYGAFLSGSTLVIPHWVTGDPLSSYYENRYNIVTGALISSTAHRDVDNINDANDTKFVMSLNSNVAAGKLNDGFNVFTSWYLRNQRGGTNITAPPSIGTTENFFTVSARPWVEDDYVYVLGATAQAVSPQNWVAKYARTAGGMPSGTAESDYFNLDANVTGGAAQAAACALTMSDDGYLYCYQPLAGSVCDLFKLDPSDMSLVHKWHLGGTLASDLVTAADGTGFTVYRGLLVVGSTTASSGGGSPGHSITRLWQLHESGSPDAELISDAQTDYDFFGSGRSGWIPLAGGYAFGYDGIIRIIAGETLGNIVASISQMAGLTASEYDVSDLPDPVLGYKVASQMTARNAIEPLRLGYFFDGAEVDDIVVFKHRNHDAIATIDDEDLGAHEPGSDTPALLETARVPDHELPQRVNLLYVNPDKSYDTGTQYSERQTGSSQSDVSLDLPIVFDDDTAKQVVDTQLFVGLLERERFKISTYRKWEKLVPTDVIEVQSRNVRIIDKRSKANGIIEFDLVVAHAAPFIQPTAGGVVGTAPGQTAAEDVVPTEAKYLDIPNIFQTDPPFGFRVAMGPEYDGPWPGAALYKSYDNVNYTQVAASGVPDVIGVTAAIGSPTTTGTVAAGAALGVVLTDDDAELTSYTAAEVAQGAGLFAVQRSDGFWNLFHYQTATLVSTDPATYELTGIIHSSIDDRSVSLHATGDAFVLLPAVTVDAPESDLNVAIYYKAVTFGLSLAETEYTIFTNTGVATESFYDTERDHLPEFSCDFGSPSITKPGLVPAPSQAACENAYILSVDGWIPQPTGGGGSPGGGGLTSPLTTKGDLWTWTTTDARLPVAADGYTIIGDSSQATGWNYWKFAPIDAPYWTSGPSSDLTNERPVSADGNVTITEGGGSPATSIVLGLSDTGVTPATYGGISSVPILTIDAKGRITFASETGTSALTGIRHPFYFPGRGLDGDITLDGSSSVSGFTLSGGNYGLNTNVCAHDLTINGGVDLTNKTGSSGCYIIACTGTLTVNGRIRWYGGDASGLTQGTAGTAGTLGTGQTGANGRNTTGAGASPGAFAASYGGVGGAGGASSGGAQPGGAAGTLTSLGSTAGGAYLAPWNFWTAAMGTCNFGTVQNLYHGGTGGGAGGRVSGASGGGGAGAAVLHLMCKYITGGGSINANGGNGGNGGAGDCGGGGGGGGGIVQAVTTSDGWQSGSPSPTVTVNGGTHGNGSTGGANGSDGNAGSIIEYLVQAMN